ncbi:hypothetical protein NQZ79_g3060 [Umbelopsis isabellina]|nr:hypothetical protein NQZ79_g3060 [Umbelopsis isabellina]
MSVKGHQKSSSTGRFTEHFDNVIAVPVETDNRPVKRGLSLRRNNNRNSLPPTAATGQPGPAASEPTSPEAPHQFAAQRQSQPPPPQQQQQPQQYQSQVQQQKLQQQPQHPPVLQQMPQEKQQINSNRSSTDPPREPGFRDSKVLMNAAHSLPPDGKGYEPPPVFRPPQHKSNSISRKSSSMSRSNAGTFNSNSDSGINPAEVLIIRLDAWRIMIKMLIEYFDEIVRAEIMTCKNYQRVAGAIQLPFRDTTQHFKEQNGVQDLCIALREGSRNVANDHEDFAKFINENVLPALARLKKEIKDRMRDMKNDEKLHVDTLWKEMDQTKKAMTSLDRICALAHQQQPNQQISHDPWLANLHVLKQLKEQIEEENRLHERMISLQREIATFERSIVENAKSAVRTFYERRAKDIYNQKSNGDSVLTVLDSLQPDTEWNEFVAKHGDQLVREDAGFKDYRLIEYPNKHDPLVQVMKKGKLSRKTVVMRSYNERFYFLTPAGYLHEFRPDDNADPELSMYIPSTTVTALEGGKNGYNIEIRGRNTVGVINRERTFTLRANSYEDQQAWYEQLKELANRPPPGPAPVPAGVPMDVRTFDIAPAHNGNEQSSYPPENYRETGPPISSDTKHLVEEEPTESNNNHVQFQDDSSSSTSLSPTHSPPRSPLPDTDVLRHTYDSDSDDSFEEATAKPSTIVRQDPPLSSPKPQHAYIGGFKPAQGEPAGENNGLAATTTT